jgi:tetratricopeptide (TPR) repeat protein
MRTHQKQANRLISQGNALHKEGNLPHAITAYQQAIDLVPAYRSFYLVIGDMQFELERYDDAAQSYITLLDEFPEHDQGWCGLGQCYMMQQRVQEAADAFDKALIHNPKDAFALYYGAMSHAALENHAKAHALLRAALVLRPDWREKADAERLLHPYMEQDDAPKWWQFWKKLGKKKADLDDDSPAEPDEETEMDEPTNYDDDGPIYG